MRLLKKIGLGILLIIAFMGVIFLRFQAYYPVKNLEIYEEATSNPSGKLESLKIKKMM